MLPAQRHKKFYIDKVSRAMFDESKNQDFDLLITIDNRNISFRDFSAFLLLIDHFYGRNYNGGFLSYAMTDSAHLRADEIRSGSIEIIIQELLRHLPVKQAIIFFLLIKYLPSALKSISESLLNTSDALYTFEKTKLIRRMRKELRRDLRDDALLQTLSDAEISKLAEDLQKKYDVDRKHIHKAARFAAKKLKSVQVRKREKR